ncbi:MAG TPA: hypothetical protein VIY73_07815 [Polyangiaceae bacterium]
MGDRHGRQSRLAGIGAEGQGRIGRASVDVRLEGLAGEVAARYLAGAGVGALKVRSEAVAAGARAVDARVAVEVYPGLAAGESSGGTALDDAGAADVFAGALAALRALKRALEGAPCVR